jgi:hypothetical protein
MYSVYMEHGEDSDDYQSMSRARREAIREFDTMGTLLPLSFYLSISLSLLPPFSLPLSYLFPAISPSLFLPPSPSLLYPYATGMQCEEIKRGEASAL